MSCYWFKFANIFPIFPDAPCWNCLIMFCKPPMPPKKIKINIQIHLFHSPVLPLLTVSSGNSINFIIVFVFILSAISLCTTGLKALYDPSDCTSTVQLSYY